MKYREQLKYQSAKIVKIMKDIGNEIMHELYTKLN